MRNLYIFILKTIHVFLFLILVGISIYLIYKSSNYKQWALNAWAKEVTGPVLKLQSNYKDWIRVRKENSQLIEQNKNLLTIVFNHDFDTSHIETIHHGDSLLFEYHTAKVIESTVNKQNNYIIIDKGSHNGIRPDMGVISTQGVVGIIKEVSPNFSIALPVIHSKFTLFAKVRDTDASGMMTWDGVDARYAQLANLPHIEGVKVLDTIVTQHSLIFPPNYPIGIVESILPETSGGYFVINVRLLASFDRLRNVYIIEQKYSEELNELMINANINE